jgi:hypothetical protein
VDEIDAAVACTRQLMAEASRVVLGGFEVKTDADIFRYPDRYLDPLRGKEMWDLMMELKASGASGVSGASGTSEPTPRTNGPTC